MLIDMNLCNFVSQISTFLLFVLQGDSNIINRLAFDITKHSFSQPSLY